MDAMTGTLKTAASQPGHGASFHFVLAASGAPIWKQQLIDAFHPQIVT